MVRKK
jgi:hypothetical protein